MSGVVNDAMNSARSSGCWPFFNVIETIKLELHVFDNRRTAYLFPPTFLNRYRYLIPSILKDSLLDPISTNTDFVFINDDETIVKSIVVQSRFYFRNIIVGGIG